MQANKIYRLSDRIPLLIDDITVTISPLSFQEKTEIQSLMLSATDDPMKTMVAARLAIKYAVKDIQGLSYADGTDFAIVSENGTMSDNSVDELLNIPLSHKLIAVCSQLIAGIPSGFSDPVTGKKLAGVSFKKETVKKKRVTQK